MQLHPDKAIYQSPLYDIWSPNPAWEKQIPKQQFSNFKISFCFYLYQLLEPKSVLDPCMGYGIRVAAARMMGIKAVGYDISPATVKICKDNYPNLTGDFHVADSAHIPKRNNAAQLVFTCPPYWNKERYESVPGQLSDIKIYDDFLLSLTDIIHESIRVSSRYIAFVSSGFRYRGKYIDLPFDIACIFMATKKVLLHDSIVLDRSYCPWNSEAACLRKNHSKTVTETLDIFRIIP